MAIALVALVASVVLIVVMLTRQRERHRPEIEPGEPTPQRKRPTRQEKILQKLDPLPEIPTLMDLVREEIAEAGIEEIPGHEDLPGPVILKVYRRDHAVIEECTHDAYGFVVADGIDRRQATEDDVALLCDQCGEVSQAADESGTKLDDETLPE